MKSSCSIYLICPSPVFNLQEVPEFDSFDKQNSSNLYSALILNHKENFVYFKDKHVKIVYCFNEKDKDFIPSELADNSEIQISNCNEKNSAFKMLSEKYFTSYNKNLLIFSSSIGFTPAELDKVFDLLSMDDETIVLGKCGNDNIGFIGFNTYIPEFFSNINFDNLDYNSLLAEVNKHDNFVHVMGDYMVIKSLDDFKKLYTELSKKESWAYCNQDMHEQFTHLFIEYKDILK